MEGAVETVTVWKMHENYLRWEKQNLIKIETFATWFCWRKNISFSIIMLETQVSYFYFSGNFQFSLYIRKKKKKKKKKAGIYNKK